jgi:hypothetical protein
MYEHTSNIQCFLRLATEFHRSVVDMSYTKHYVGHWPLSEVRLILLEMSRYFSLYMIGNFCFVRRLVVTV